MSEKKFVIEIAVHIIISKFLYKFTDYPLSHIISTTLGSINTGSKHLCTALPRISSNKKCTKLLKKEEKK